MRQLRPIVVQKIKKMNIGFLASHNGSNMQAIIDACISGELHASPVVVISNNSKSGALERAMKEGIPHYHMSGKNYPDPKYLDQAILTVMIDHLVDIIVLAGYMKKLGQKTLARFEGRILNIHPALLPKYGGKGMYGMNVHEAVISSGENESFRSPGHESIDRFAQEHELFSVRINKTIMTGRTYPSALEKAFCNTSQVEEQV